MDSPSNLPVLPRLGLIVLGDSVFRHRASLFPFQSRILVFERASIRTICLTTERALGVTDVAEIMWVNDTPLTVILHLWEPTNDR
jgi:hypothetical protein